MRLEATPEGALIAGVTLGSEVPENMAQNAYKIGGDQVSATRYRKTLYQ